MPAAANIKERLFNIRELPTIPVLHNRILKLIDEGSYSLDDLIGLIERDQVLSGKVLKLVNSPFYGLYSKVASVGKSIVLIGSNPVRGIILSTSLFDIADKKLPGLWDHSYCCSVVSGFLANRFNMKDIGEIMTAALLHDIGKVLIRKQLAEESKEIDETVQSRRITAIDAEKIVIDVTHDAVGSWIAGQWNFLPIINDIIAYHHKPGLCGAYPKEAAIVHLADIIVKGWHGEFHTMAVSGGTRGERIELKHIRCHDDITKFIMDGMKDKNTVAVDFLPKELCLSKITSNAVVSPLTCKGKEIGVLIAESDETDETKVQLMDSIARYISMGLENHTIYREWMGNRIEMTHEIETLQLMYEIGKEILFNLNAEEIIETVVLMIRRIIPCDGVSMAVTADDDGHALKVTASWGTGMDKGEEIGEDVPFYAIVKKGKSFYQNDITLDFKKYPTLLKWAEEKHVYSYLCAPLMIKGKLFGAFILSSVRPAWLTHIHIAIIEKIATQVGIALENAKLMEDLEEIFMGTIKSLIAAIDAKSRWTKGHSDRVVNYAVKIGEKLRRLFTDILNQG